MIESSLTQEPLRTACFTGHRPEKIRNITASPELFGLLLDELERRTLFAICRGYDIFLCGMQRGIDIWAGQTVLRLKKEFGELKLVCVSPFSGEISGRRGADLEDYLELKEGCDSFVTLSDVYDISNFKARNDYMVRHSSLLIGAVSDYKSGTGQTIAMARRQGLSIDIIDLNRLGQSSNDILHP